MSSAQRDSFSVEKKISHDDDKVIDFKRLERELDNAVEAEAKYWRENEAKFRAVHQKVATYDEFRDIVMASHLKPLEKDDRLTNMKFTQPWNTQAKKKDNTANREETADIPKGKEYPTSGQAFIREWRKFNKNTSHQYSYLIELGGERLGTIFRTEIGFGLLGEFTHCLKCELNEQDVQHVSTILHRLSETNRFSLTVDFLSKSEKQDIVDLFELLTKFIDNESVKDNVMLNDLEKLTKVYGVKK